jgi:FkbM family methyltransferase
LIPPPPPHKNILLKIKQAMKAVLKKPFLPIIRRYRLLGELDNIVNKLSLVDEIVELKGARFWVPNAPRDFIQNTQLSTGSFYEFEILQRLDRYLSNNSVVIDIGANVGNHTVYWGKITKVKKVYAFEPIKTTFNILLKNIEINNLIGKVKIYNVGLGDKTAKGAIKEYYINNIGGTVISEDDDGDIELNVLDNFYEIIEEPMIDFVKIDVEGFEKNVISGANNFFYKHRPIVFIETFPGVNEYDFVYEFFGRLNYNLPIKYNGNNYLFIPKKER